MPRVGKNEVPKIRQDSYRMVAKSSMQGGRKELGSRKQGNLTVEIQAKSGASGELETWLRVECDEIENGMLEMRAKNEFDQVIWRRRLARTCEPNTVRRVQKEGWGLEERGRDA